MPTPPPTKVPTGFPSFHHEIWTATDAMLTWMVRLPRLGSLDGGTVNQPVPQDMPPTAAVRPQMSVVAITAGCDEQHICTRSQMASPVKITLAAQLKVSAAASAGLACAEARSGR